MSGQKDSAASEDHPYHVHVKACESCSGPYGHCSEGLRLLRANTAASEGIPPQRIWMNPRTAGLYAQPEYMRDPNDTEEYARVRSDSPSVDAAELLREAAREYATRAARLNGDDSDAGLEAARDYRIRADTLRHYADRINAVAVSPSVDKATIWNLAKKITYFEEGHCFTSCPEHWTKSVAEIIEAELNNSEKVGTTPLTDRAEQNTSGEMKNNTPPANVERT